MIGSEPPDEADFAVRPATPADASILATLIAELGYPTDAAHMLARLNAMDSRNDTVLVATERTEVVATVALHVVAQLHQDAPLAYVSSLVVATAMRGRGIGERLMRAVEAEAVERGCYRVELVSRRTRGPAHRLYERLGYEETSSRTYRFVRTPRASRQE